MYLKGIEYEIVEEPLRKWTKWMQVWSLETGERPRVPVLHSIDTDSETVLPESNDILLFLDQAEGSATYTPEADSEAYTRMHEWWSWCDEKLKPAIDMYKYGEDRVWDANKNVEYAEKLNMLLTELERHLEDHAFLVEERLTLADMSVMPFVRQIMRTRGGKFDFSGFPKIVAWTDTVFKQDWFDEIVMKKYPLAVVGE
jgi:glutathione S-transferase